MGQRYLILNLTHASAALTFFHVTIALASLLCPDPFFSRPARSTIWHERMPSDSRRRSGRIPKQLAIFLLGSDIDGRIFSEETKTVVLSRHGAGITSQYKLSPEQEIIIRGVDSGKEADARVVGQIGSQDNTYIYGVAFLDPALNFWGLDFGELTDAEKQASRALLECSSCQLRETVDHSDLEADVFAINRSAVRYCKRCGSSTVWKRAAEEAAASPTPVPARSLETVPEIASAEADPIPTAASTAREGPPAKSRSTLEPDRPAEHAPVALRGATLAPSERTPAAPTAVARPEDRRKHARTRVKFKACIRRPGMADDIVSCEDMSRGGLRFKSKKQYFATTMIEVAVPYSPGDQSIFVPGEIVYVHETPGEGMFHCGVAYIKSSR